MSTYPGIGEKSHLGRRWWVSPVQSSSAQLAGLVKMKDRPFSKVLSMRCSELVGTDRKNDDAGVHETLLSERAVESREAGEIIRSHVTLPLSGGRLWKVPTIIISTHPTLPSSFNSWKFEKILLCENDILSPRLPRFLDRDGRVGLIRCALTSYHTAGDRQQDGQYRGRRAASHFHLYFRIYNALHSLSSSLSRSFSDYTCYDQLQALPVSGLLCRCAVHQEFRTSPHSSRDMCQQLLWGSSLGITSMACLKNSLQLKSNGFFGFTH